MRFSRSGRSKVAQFETETREHHIFDTPKKRKWIELAIWATLGVLGIYFVAALVTWAVYARTDDSGFESDRPEFHYYKNTRFRECAAATTPLNETCADFEASLGKAEDGYLALWRPPSNRTSWCDAVACLRNYKINPSKPEPSAFRVDFLALWISTTWVCISLLWSVKTDTFEADHAPHECEGVKLQNVLLLPHSIVSLGTWWYDF